MLLDGDTRTFPTTRTNGHGFVGSSARRTTAAGNTTERELAPTNLSSNKEAGRPGYYDQRDELLPIHARNIPDFQPVAT